MFRTVTKTLLGLPIALTASLGGAAIAGSLRSNNGQQRSIDAFKKLTNAGMEAARVMQGKEEGEELSYTGPDYDPNAKGTFDVEVSEKEGKTTVTSSNRLVGFAIRAVTQAARISGVQLSEPVLNFMEDATDHELKNFALLMIHAHESGLIDKIAAFSPENDSHPLLNDLKQAVEKAFEGIEDPREKMSAGMTAVLLKLADDFDKKQDTSIDREALKSFNEKMTKHLTNMLTEGKLDHRAVISFEPKAPIIGGILGLLGGGLGFNAIFDAALPKHAARENSPPPQPAV